MILVALARDRVSWETVTTLGHVSSVDDGWKVFTSLAGEEQWAVDMGSYLLSWLYAIMTISNLRSLGGRQPQILQAEQFYDGVEKALWRTPGSARRGDAWQRLTGEALLMSVSTRASHWVLLPLLHATSRDIVTSCILLDTALCSCLRLHSS